MAARDMDEGRGTLPSSRLHATKFFLAWSSRTEPVSLWLVPSLVFPGTEKRMLNETDMPVQGFLKENIAKYFNKTSSKDANHHLVHKDPLTWLNTIQGDNWDKDRRSQRAARQAGCNDILWDSPQTPEWKLQALRNPITVSEKDLPPRTSNNSSKHPRLESAGAAALPNVSVLNRDLQPTTDRLNRVKTKSQVYCYIYSASGTCT